MKTLRFPMLALHVIVLSLTLHYFAQVAAAPLVPHVALDSIYHVVKPHDNTLRNSTVDEGASYRPPPNCSTPCHALLENLAKCEDDSCICSQDGVNGFTKCAECDTRLVMKQGGVNVKDTFIDLKQICEHQGYSMSDVTLPAINSTTPNTQTTNVAVSDIAASSTALKLTSAAYASLSIASGSGWATSSSNPAASSTSEPAVNQEAQIGAANRLSSRASILLSIAACGLVITSLIVEV